MRVLKVTGLGLVGLVVLVLAAAYALPRQVVVERSLVIAAEPDEIFPYLNSMKNFNAWSPWADLDPETVYIFSGPEFGKGARSEWSSDHFDVGNGSQEIVRSVPNELVRTLLDFEHEGTAEGYYKLARVDTGTRVVWGFETDMGMNPVARYVGLMLDRLVGDDFARGLDRLKSLVEEGEV